MLIEAIYDHGWLEFPVPLKLKHDRVRLVVDVPDEEIAQQPHPFELSEEALQSAQEMLDEFIAIRDAPLPPDDELPAVTPTQIERIEAFGLRARVRAEHGRVE